MKCGGCGTKIFRMLDEDMRELCFNCRCWVRSYLVQLKKILRAGKQLTKLREGNN